MYPQQPDLFTPVTRSATLCRQRIYRYELWRTWHAGILAAFHDTNNAQIAHDMASSSRYVNFICLNPSTADESTDDPTVRKCVKFARSWGFDALCITNLFAYRATDFRLAMKTTDPVGFGNDRHIISIARNASLVVCAWGLNGVFMSRGSIVRRMIARFDPHYLRLTREQPWHPLYLPDNTQPSRWHSRGYLNQKEKN